MQGHTWEAFRSCFNRFVKGLGGLNDQILYNMFKYYDFKLKAIYAQCTHLVGCITGESERWQSVASLAAMSVHSIHLSFCRILSLLGGSNSSGSVGGIRLFLYTRVAELSMRLLFQGVWEGDFRSVCDYLGQYLGGCLQNRTRNNRYNPLLSLEMTRRLCRRVISEDVPAISLVENDLEQTTKYKAHTNLYKTLMFLCFLTMPQAFSVAAHVLLGRSFPANSSRGIGAMQGNTT